jgi:hypothetical protein
MYTISGDFGSALPAGVVSKWASKYTPGCSNPEPRESLRAHPTQRENSMGCCKDELRWTSGKPYMGIWDADLNGYHGTRCK